MGLLLIHFTRSPFQKNFSIYSRDRRRTDAAAQPIDTL